jgi:hypothetical protein
MLHTHPTLVHYIDELVQATSELEARGNLVYTYALLKCCEEEQCPPPEMFSQGFITRCFGSVQHEQANQLYVSSTLCTHYLQLARHHVPAMSTYDFKYLTQTINQLGRRFHTMFMTSLQTHLQTRQKKNVYTFIQTLYPTHSKSMNNYLVHHILWSISGASLSSFTYPIANKYKDHLLINKNANVLLTSPAVTIFIQTHRQHLQFPSTVVIDPNHGYWTTKTFVQHPEYIFI